MSSASFPFYDHKAFFAFVRRPKRDHTSAPARSPSLDSWSSTTQPYTPYSDPHEYSEGRNEGSRVPAKVRILQAVARTMSRRAGTFRGSVDDTVSPPTLYQWIQAALNGEAIRLEASTDRDVVCLFCSQRCPDMKAHLEQFHGDYWRQGVLQRAQMRAQDIVGSLFFVALLAERDGPQLDKEEEYAFQCLLEGHNHVSFAYPGDPFPIIFDRLRPLTGRALAWAMCVPAEEMRAFRKEQTS